MSKKPGEGTVTEGSGNVFADLGLPDAEELLAKAQLASTISDIIKGRHLTQTEAASVLGTTQPKVSNLVRGRLEGFSLERLARFLNSLDRDVEIRVKRRPRSRQTSRIRVKVG
jgi:predicted XRE-type DNA-binding protein